jgi:hypothetical protein
MGRGRAVIAGAMLALGLALFTSPALGQVYTGVTPPGVGGGLGSGPTGAVPGTGGVLGTGGTGATPAAATPAGQVLASRVSAPPAAVPSAQVQGGGLAFTGADVMSLIAMAIPLITVGALLVRRSRLQPVGDA